MDLFPEISLSDVAGAKPKGSSKGVFKPLLEHYEGDTYILRIDNSTMERFQTCPRSALYYCVSRRQAPPSVALAYGGAIHAGLEKLYLLGYSHPRILDIMQDAAREHMSHHCTESLYDWRTPDRACHTLTKYFETYENTDSITPIIVEDKPYVERAFSLPVGQIEINSELAFSRQALLGGDNDDSPLYVGTLLFFWSGRLDIAAHYNGQRDSVYVVDHKTTSIAGPGFYNDFYLAQQTVGYCWALDQILPDKSVWGLVLNAIIGRKPTPSGKSLEFQRQVYLYTPERRDEFVKDITHQAETFVYSLLHGYFPKSTKWCFDKYGQCSYHPVCSLNSPAQRDIHLMSDAYSDVTWDPLAH